MKLRASITRILLFVMVLSVSGAMASFAADYPTKLITLMVPWAAGGGTDVGARILAAIAEKKVGQPIIVVNKVGAGSQLGMTELARAKPDGYYLGFASLPATNTIILDPERKAAFDVDSFLPIINQVLDPGLIWVKADSPYKSVQDLLDDAKKRQGQVRASTTGILGDDHLAILMMEKAAGVTFRIVHFEGGAQQFTATLGGQVDVSFDNVGSVVTKIRAGQVRGLAVMDKERSKFLPEVPTLGEVGFPNIISSSTRGIMGPKGIPDSVVKKIQDIFLTAMKDPDHVEKMEKVGLAVMPMLGAEYIKYFKDVHETCKAYMEEARKAR
ncbi:MAG: tripartite tricarboxylate transporter substrate binding protein [Deltaproteobacteria bacterium]|nr:tripartite tricarboxylate transporter substrate binding protein [Deltaproteobacteria bacterium]